VHACLYVVGVRTKLCAWVPKYVLCGWEGCLSVCYVCVCRVLECVKCVSCVLRITDLGQGGAPPRAIRASPGGGSPSTRARSCCDSSAMVTCNHVNAATSTRACSLSSTRACRRCMSSTRVCSCCTSSRTQRQRRPTYLQNDAVNVAEHRRGGVEGAHGGGVGVHKTASDVNHSDGA
jgi:hypothetical protein